YSAVGDKHRGHHRGAQNTADTPDILDTTRDHRRSARYLTHSLHGMSSEREKQFLGGKRYVSRRCTSGNLPFSVSLPVAWASAPCGEVKTLSDERGARPSCGSVRCRDCAAEARLLRQQERTTESEVGMPLTKTRSASLSVTQRLTAGPS